MYVHRFPQKELIFTARKRSLGQGNMFTGVCLSREGCLVWGVPAPSGGAWLGVPGLGGAWSRGDAWSGGVPGGDPPRRLLLVFGEIALDKLFFMILVKLQFYTTIMLKRETNYNWRPLNFEIDFNNLYFVLSNMTYITNRYLFVPSGQKLAF